MKEIMFKWDLWRSYIASGGKASWPRDEFKNLIGRFEKDIENLKSHITLLESQLSKRTAEHKDQELQWMKEQADQPSLGAKQAYINALEQRVKYLESQKEELEKTVNVLEKEWQRLQEVFQVLNEAHSKAEAKIKELEKEIEKLKEKILRMIRGDFKQICSYRGWESREGQWEELQNHLKECPEHPLGKAETSLKRLRKGIEKHKSEKECSLILGSNGMLHPAIDDIDEELYKLVEKG